MRKQNDLETEQTVELFYKNVHRLVSERGIKVKDLSMSIGLGPRTLSSMKSQNQNPGLMTILKIAKVLDVPLDELIDDAPDAHRDINDLIWFLQSIKDSEKAPMIAQQLMSVGKAIKGDSVVQEASPRYEVSMSITQERVQENLNKYNTEKQSTESHESISYDED